MSPRRTPKGNPRWGDRALGTGKSGNPKGRPPSGDSMAEIIRAAASIEDKVKAAEKLWSIAKDEHGDPNARIKAFAVLCRHGWPAEASGVLSVETDAQGRLTKVVHEYHPS